MRPMRPIRRALSRDRIREVAGSLASGSVDVGSSAIRRSASAGAAAVRGASSMAGSAASGAANVLTDIGSGAINVGSAITSGAINVAGVIGSAAYRRMIAGNVPQFQPPDRIRSSDLPYFVPGGGSGRPPYITEYFDISPIGDAREEMHDIAELEIFSREQRRQENLALVVQEVRDQPSQELQLLPQTLAMARGAQQRREFEAFRLQEFGDHLVGNTRNVSYFNRAYMNESIRRQLSAATPTMLYLLPRDLTFPDSNLASGVIRTRRQMHSPPMRALPPSGGYPIAPATAAASTAYPSPQQASSSSSSSRMPSPCPTPPQREQTLFEIDGKNIFQYGSKKTISQMTRLQAIQMHNLMAHSIDEPLMLGNPNISLAEIERRTRTLYNRHKFKFVNVKVK